MITTEQAINLLASAYENEVIKGGRGCGKTAFRTALLMGAKALDKDNIQDVVYKDGTFVCPGCGYSTLPLAVYGGNYCIKCGKHVRWREIIKAKK